METAQVTKDMRRYRIKLRRYNLPADSLLKSYEVTGQLDAGSAKCRGNKRQQNRAIQAIKILELMGVGHEVTLTEPNSLTEIKLERVA